jgi:ABC-2 type transport system permease protein
MIAAFRAEVLKLRKRPGVLILLATMFSVVLLFGYLLLYAVATQASTEDVPGFDPTALTDLLRPDALLVQVLGIVAGPGVAIALILGALAVGAEYNWHTVKTMVTQRPQRVPLVAGRSVAVLTICIALTAAAVAGGVAGTGLVSLLDPADSAWPSLVDTAAAFGVALLTVAVWCAVGMCLATVFRSTAWAIGVGLLYALAVESALGLLPLGGRLGDVVAQILVANNVTALVVAAVPAAASSFGAPAVPISAGQAAAVLLVYLVGSLGVAAAVFARRDIAG